MSVRAKSAPLANSGSARRFGQRVGETVSEIQCSRVPAFPESAPCGSGDFNLFRIYRNDFKARAKYKEVKLTSSVFPVTGFQRQFRIQERSLQKLTSWEHSRLI